MMRRYFPSLAGRRKGRVHPARRNLERSRHLAPRDAIPIPDREDYFREESAPALPASSGHRHNTGMAPLALNRQQSREVDRIAIEEYGIPGLVLMENAGLGCVDVL